jgi:UDP-N-acetyl-D-glucosamine dehydrogenase
VNLELKIKYKVAVIGLGYVGLPLALEAAKFGHEVIGIDNDLKKIDLIQAGVSPIEDISNKMVFEVSASGRLKVSNNFKEIKDSEVVIICVPTPLSKNRSTDLSFLERAISAMCPYLNKDCLIVIESTVAPGTVREFVVPLLKLKTNSLMIRYKIAFSPERIDPRNKIWNLKNTPKLVSGLNQLALKAAYDFYSEFIDTVVECSSLEVAETAKLLENSFRLVNISFINEIGIFCERMGVDINEVIKVAATKPYGFLPFYPSSGAGGHCIPVDSIYLSEKAQELGAPIRSIELAAEINRQMPRHFVSRAAAILNGLAKKKILVIGVAYKSNLADVRETPVEFLISGLKEHGAIVSWHDEIVADWNGEKSVALSHDFDLAIIATLHDYIDLSKLGPVPILNTRGSI